MGIVDKYLRHSHPIGDEGRYLAVGSPRLGTCAYSVSFGMLAVIHAFTWNNELILNFSFSEAKMGSLEEQERALRTGKGEATMLKFIDEWVGLIERVAFSEV